MSFFSNIFKRRKVLLEEHKNALSEKRDELIAKNRILIKLKQENHPLIKTKNKLLITLFHLKRKREDTKNQWITAYERFSWWNKLKYPERIDLSELDESICELEHLQRNFSTKYSADIKVLEDYYQRAIERSEYRIGISHKKLLEIIEKTKIKEIEEDNLFNKAFWFCKFSISTSVWDDFVNTTNVYDSLRKVNGKFRDMSDTEIWWETLWLSEESLSGLINLTKGAYFEDLVAKDTGGELFEHFNNPDTDIAIDGVLFQLKATDSIAYIATVDEDIPIIATTEVAEKTGVIDSGYSNEELTNTVVKWFSFSVPFYKCI